MDVVVFLGISPLGLDVIDFELDILRDPKNPVTLMTTFFGPSDLPSRLDRAEIVSEDLCGV